MLKVVRYHSFPLLSFSYISLLDQVSVAYDGAGTVFGVLCEDGRTRKRSLKLFDVRSFDQGPFLDLAPSLEQLVTTLSSSQNSNGNNRREEGGMNTGVEGQNQVEDNVVSKRDFILMLLQFYSPVIFFSITSQPITS